MDARLETFLNTCRSVTKDLVDPADIVLELAPYMVELLEDTSFLGDEHRRSNPEHYARNQVYVCPEGALSLFAMVWSPGQWTPVHDHGTWGLVGVVDGILTERSFIRTDTRAHEDSGIELHRGGVSMLSPGTVTSFVPNPDHIHRAGVPEHHKQTVSLHLYGRHMDNYNVYDLELGRRTPVEVSPEEIEDVPAV